ncbi:MAG: hypothetical protein HRU11_04595 [Parvularculaceae bacterium]|nr:hypothetical protein [Parvularculaceae bacterium]
MILSRLDRMGHRSSRRIDAIVARIDELDDARNAFVVVGLLTMLKGVDGRNRAAG